MEILLIILIVLIVILLFPLLSAAGWAMKGIGEIFDLMWDGFSNFFGCIFQILLWILVIAFVIYSLI